MRNNTHPLRVVSSRSTGYFPETRLVRYYANDLEVLPTKPTGVERVTTAFRDNGILLLEGVACRETSLEDNVERGSPGSSGTSPYINGNETREYI